MPRVNANARRTEPAKPGPGIGPIDTSGFESFPGSFDDPGTESGPADTGTESEPTSSPATPATPGPGAPEKRRPGRPPGTGTKTGPRNKATESVQVVSKIKDTLLMVHAVGAKVLGAPEIELTDKDAGELAKSIDDVRQLYPAARIDPKLLAWGTLAVNAFGTYSIIYAAVSNRYKREAARRKLSVMPPPAPAAPEPVQHVPAPATAQSGAFTGISVPSQFHPAAPVGDSE